MTQIAERGTSDGKERKHRPTGLELHFEDPRRRDEPVYRQPPRSGRGMIEPERLSLWFLPEAPFELPEFVQRVRAYRDAVFVTDSSFFDASIDQSVWIELLSGVSPIVLLGQVREELAGWLAKVPDHPAAVAVHEQRFTVVDPAAWPTATQNAYVYYVNLLGVRKRLYRLAEIQLESKLGRQATPAELLHAKREISRILGPRAVLLARKGSRGDPTKQTYATDEIVIVAAFLIAIEKSQAVVILTRDQDLLELFYKMQWLLDTHYRGWFLADRYAADPAKAVVRPMPTGPPWSEAFTGEGNLLVARSSADPEAVRGIPAYPIPIECWLVRDSESRIGFPVESGMKNLIEAKGQTGGLNHPALAPRNFHVWLAPLPIPRELRGYSAVATDLRQSIAETGVAIPLHDINQSILTEERMRLHVGLPG